MKKASSSFLVFLFAALLVSFQSFAQVRYNPQQEQRTIREHVGQNLRMYERLRLSDLLRLSLQEQRNLELISLSITAQSLRPAQVELSQNGRPLASATVRRNKQEVRFQLPSNVRVDGLELSSAAEIFLESVVAEVSHLRPGPGPGPHPGHDPQVTPNSFITLQVNQQVRGRAQLHLKQMVKQQLGLSLAGAEIERVVVQGDPIGYGRAASVQVELNNRLVGQAKALSHAQNRLPLVVQSNEVVRSLQLVVSGDAHIQTVAIRVGQVRPEGPQGPHLPQTQRIHVQQEVSPRMPLELSRLLGYDSRLISFVTIEARSLRALSTQVSLMGGYGEIQGALMVQQHSVRATIRLRRPMAAHELRIEAHTPALIESIEIQFDQYPY